MEAPPRADDVLHFLTSHGFSRAASALRDDLLSRSGDAVSSPLGSPPFLPPVRTALPTPLPDLYAAASSSTSDDFVTPYEMVNPYGVWSSPRSKSDDSSSSDMEFGTAREDAGFNIFGETSWYDDDRYPHYIDGGDPYGLPASTSEDKFVMSIEAEERFGKVGSCSVPLCDCCAGDGAGKASSSVYGRYRIMPDATERLDECGDDLFQLKQVDVRHQAVCLDGDVFLDLNRNGENERSELPPGEIGLVNSYAFEEINRANGHLTRDPNISLTSKHQVESSFLTKADKDELRERDSKMNPMDDKVYQPDTNDGRKLQQNGKIDEDFQDPETVIFEGEDCTTANEPQISSSHEDEYEIFHLRIIHRKNRTGFEENKDLPIILNSVIAGRYLVTEYLGSAAFSKVVRAHDLQTGVDVCLKIIKNDKDFFDQSLDEIKLLKFVNKYDPADECHLLRLYDYFYHQEHLFIVCELLRANLYEFQKYNHESGGEAYFTMPRIQSIAQQCLEALEYLHHLRIIHCDLKPENILIKSYSRCEIKIIDLGSSCFQTDNLCLYVQSRSYRAPEVILGLPYDEKIDIWSLGCVLAELYTGDVLFPNDSVVMILARMIATLGPVDMEMLERGQETTKYFTDDYDLYIRNEDTGQVEYLIPEKSSLARYLKVTDPAFIDFLRCLLQINPKRRLTASQALEHPWLSSSYV